MCQVFVGIGDTFFKKFWCFFWSSGFDQSKPIAHSMDMCIHSDKQFIVEYMSDYFGCLYSYARKLHQLFKSIRYSTPIFLTIIINYSFFIINYFCGSKNMFRLRMIVIDGRNWFFKRSKSHLQKIFRFFYFFKERICDFIDLYICRLRRQHHCYNKLKRSRVVKLCFWIWKKLLEIRKYFFYFFIHSISNSKLMYSGSVGIEPTPLASEASILPLNYDPILIPPYFITHTFLIDAISDHLLIFIERRDSAFDFQKDYFSQISPWEPIEDKIVDPFSQKHQILIRIRKIG